jgi:flagellar motility protein MotE (MotC chaperone)
MESAAQRLAGTIPPVTEVVEKFGTVNKTAADRVAAHTKSVKELRLEHLSLTNPVFAAERAIDDYNEAVAEAGPIATRTQEENEGLLESYVAMKEAEANVGIENIRAVEDSAAEMAISMGETADSAGDFVSNMAAVDTRSLTETERVIQRWESIVNNPVIVKIEASLPTQGNIDALVVQAIDRAARNRPQLISGLTGGTG